MIKTAVCAAVTAFIVVTGAAAQSGRQDLGIAGTVVNSVTGEPVKRALVRIVRFAMPDRANTAERARAPRTFTTSTLTDAGGGFRFAALAPGEYIVSAEKPQYAGAGRGRETQRVKLTESVANVTVQISPLGVISGKVADQNGAPLRGVNVLALTVRMEDGTRQTHAFRNVTTDDRGMYRLWNIEPGKYYIKAAGLSGGTRLYHGDVTPQLFADESFTPTYFGGGGILDGATPLEVRAGAQVEADVTLRMQPSYKIRGALTNALPHRTVKFELVAGAEDVTPSRVTVNGDNGRFEIQDALPGAYILRATQDENVAEVGINVGGGDINGVSLTLAAPVDVKAVTQFTNTPPEAPKWMSTPPEPPQGMQRPRRAIGGGACMVNLIRPGKAYTSNWGESGESAVKSVQPGRYRVALRCFGAYVRSAVTGTQDLLTSPGLTIAPALAPAPIEIVATYGGGQMEGVIAAPAGGEEQNIQVLLVPAFAGNTGPQIIPAFQAGGNEFRFQTAGLAPGSYTVYAFLNRDDLEYRSPRFLESLSGGTTVLVEDKAQKSVRLTVTR